MGADGTLNEDKRAAKPFDIPLLQPLVTTAITQEYQTVSLLSRGSAAMPDASAPCSLLPSPPAAYSLRLKPSRAGNNVRARCLTNGAVPLILGLKTMVAAPFSAPVAHARCGHCGYNNMTEDIKKENDPNAGKCRGCGKPVAVFISSKPDEPKKPEK